MPPHEASAGEGDGTTLASVEVTYYLPQVVKEDRTPQGRKIRSVVPLFTSYLFLRGDDHDRVEALKSNRLVNVLEVVDQDTLWRDLRQIHQVLSSGLTVVPEPVMPVGARVRIKTGPLMGIEGTVIRRGKPDQFVAIVHFLGAGRPWTSKIGRSSESRKGRTTGRTPDGRPPHRARHDDSMSSSSNRNVHGSASFSIR